MRNFYRFRSAGRQLLDRIHVRLSKSAPLGEGFVFAPEPRSIGRPERGRQLVAGDFHFSGVMQHQPQTAIWALTSADPAFTTERHGFGWLDDLAALGNAAAQNLAQEWTLLWIKGFGHRYSSGWHPRITGRRLIRWVHHAQFILQRMNAEQSQQFWRSISRQSVYLSKRWASAPRGMARLEALCGLLIASLCVEGLQNLTAPALEHLAGEIPRSIDPSGAMPARNPEELLQVFAMLTWVKEAMHKTHLALPQTIDEGIERIAVILRSLRHSDGTLARFHGGGVGTQGWLDHALANARSKAQVSDGLAMGFARLATGRSSVIIDAAPPPVGAHSVNAHASCLAFEFTSKYTPLIVNAGPGQLFGKEWGRAARSSAFHSTLELNDTSSATFVQAEGENEPEPLSAGPTEVPFEQQRFADRIKFEGAHDGYLSAFGLLHSRSLELDINGDWLMGEEYLLALEEEHKHRFEQHVPPHSAQGLPFRIRFHLHPQIDADLDSAQKCVTLWMKSGEAWQFQCDNAVKITLQDSSYMQCDRLMPRTSLQIVLSGQAVQHTTRIRWSLAKVQEATRGIGELKNEDLI